MYMRNTRLFGLFLLVLGLVGVSWCYPSSIFEALWLTSRA